MPKFSDTVILKSTERTISVGLYTGGSVSKNLIEVIVYSHSTRSRLCEAQVLFEDWERESTGTLKSELLQQLNDSLITEIFEEGTAMIRRWQRKEDN